MFSRTRIVLCSAVVAGLLAAPQAYATNGYFVPGYGMKNLALGGAVTADPQDAYATTANPAGEAFVPDQVTIGAWLFSPHRQAAMNGSSGLVTTNANTEGRSGATLFLIPEMAFSYQVNNRVGIGMAVVANGGMSTRYNYDFFNLITGRPTNQALGVNLAQLLILPTISYKVTPTVAIGVAPIFGVQSFRAYGMGSFASSTFSSAPKHVTNQGSAWAYGVGVRTGILARFLDNRLAVGASWASKVYMTKFDKYRGLFAGGGGFDVPSNFSAGIAITPIKPVTVSFDVQRILYGQIPSIANPGPGLGQPFTNHMLGSPNGFGFGWQDMTVYKLGVTYRYSDHWTFRAGYNYGKSPIPDNQLLFNLLAPGLVERHYSIGASYSPSPTTQWTVAYMYVPRKTEICTAPGCTTFFTGTKGQFIGAQMWQYTLGLDFAYKF